MENDNNSHQEMEEKLGMKPKAGEIFGRLGQAKGFVEKQPVYYSPENFWWVWNFEKYCYELQDETDLLNGIRNEMSIDTVGSRARGEIVSALKQVGREQAPKEKPKGWIQFKDTLINPKTLEQEKSTHKYLLTNPIPHKLGKSEETPVLDKLLREWVVKEGIQDESYVQSLYECLAYSLTDDLFMQRIIALTGGGSNGKGTFLKVIERLAGFENCVSMDLRTLSKRDFATSCIFKKLVAFAGEVGYNDLTNTNILKSITGQDLLRYEFKGKGAFTDTCITTFFIATNSLPITSDKTLGFYRRWVIIDFPNIFPIKANVIDKIPEEEYENLCLKSVNILKRLYETHKFTNEGNYEDREKKYEERSNPLPSFIDASCEEVIGETVALKKFSDRFNVWLKTKKLRVMNVKQVGVVLRSEGYTIGKRRQNDNSFVGILNMTFKTSETVQSEQEKQASEEHYSNLADQKELI